MTFSIAPPSETCPEVTSKSYILLEFLCNFKLDVCISQTLRQKLCIDFFKMKTRLPKHFEKNDILQIVHNLLALIA